MVGGAEGRISCRLPGCTEKHGTGGAQDPKRGAQDPDPDVGALKIAPSEGVALGILCLGRGRHRSRPVRWGAEDLSAPAGTTQILAKKEALPRSRHTVSGAQDLRSQTGALKILTRNNGAKLPKL